jgi:vancomycin permeability regulator SanA
MRRLFSFIFQLIFLAVVILAATAVWMVFDGLNDQGEKADLALVAGHQYVAADGENQPKLDRIVTLYNQGAFPAVLVGGPVTSGFEDEPAKEREYLQAHGIPAGAISEDNHAINTAELAADTASSMHEHQQRSVMLVTDYYRMTRLKLALSHEGVKDIFNMHTGALVKEDAFAIGREVLAFYDYVGRTFLLPAAQKAKEEVKVGADKAKVEAEKAKDDVDKKIDNLKK